MRSKNKYIIYLKKINLEKIYDISKSIKAIKIAKLAKNSEKAINLALVIFRKTTKNIRNLIHK